MSICCVEGSEWSGTPSGRVEKLGNHDTYVVGSNKEVAILVIHDVFGWTFTNTRLLADHYALEVNATVYLPDLYVIVPHTFHFHDVKS
jgi:dienelactone hydrolase